MINFDFGEYCCGCSACFNICPTGAISMIRDIAGFPLPHVNPDKCISCGLCEKVCPHLNPPEAFDQNGTQSYLYHSNDSLAKLRSSSGGAFYELAKKTAEKGGVVFGCAWDEHFHAIHIAGNDARALERMQGSKYVQSDLGSCYAEILEALESGKEVLFSGTPCQAAAVTNFIKSCGRAELLPRLLSVAVICHGVPAPAAWQNYRSWLEKKAGSKLASVNFRDKSVEGYKRNYCRYQFESGKTLEYPTFLGDRYIMAGLVYNLCLRNCCSHCDFKGLLESCDIMLGDWYAACEGEGQLGTSCIIGCSDKGIRAVTQRLSSLREIDYPSIAAANPFLTESAQKGKKREAFLGALTGNIYDSAEKYFPIKHKIKMLLVKLGLFDRARRLLRRV